MRENIPIIICVDVEPEEREIDKNNAKDWQGFEEIFRFLSGVRNRLEKSTEAPVSFSWFLRMDPQIERTYGLAWWVAKRYDEAIAQLESAGDELGLHTHAWRWDTDSLRWVIDHADQNWIEHCLRVSFQAFQRAFGRPCLSFRFGDRWMNDATMDLLEAIGLKFDLTIEPGMKAKPAMVLEELHTGFLPDYTDTPRRPYRPSRLDFRKHCDEQGRGLWAIPLSTGRLMGRLPNVKRVGLRFGIDLRRRHETIQLNFGLDGKRFRELMNSLLHDRCEPYLAPVVRTDVGVHSVLRTHMEENLEFMASHPLVNRFRFVRPADAVKLLAET